MNDDPINSHHRPAAQPAGVVDVLARRDHE
jgi:hypothetical protein